MSFEVYHATVMRRPLRGLPTSTIVAASHRRMWMESVVTTEGRSHSVCNRHAAFWRVLNVTDVQAGLNIPGKIVHIDPNRTTWSSLRFHSGTVHLDGIVTRNRLFRPCAGTKPWTGFPPVQPAGFPDDAVVCTRRVLQNATGRVRWRRTHRPRARLVAQFRPWSLLGPAERCRRPGACAAASPGLW